MNYFIFTVVLLVTYGLPLDFSIILKNEAVYFNPLIKPLSYQLKFDTSKNKNYQKQLYYVQVNITLRIGVRIKSILLHCDDALDIWENMTRLSKLKENGEVEEFEVYRHRRTNNNDVSALQIEVNLFKETHEARYVLSLYCSKEIEDDRKPPRRIQSKKNYRILMATIPMDAHRIFPCFDEAKWKSTFDVEVVHDESHRAITTAPLLMQERITKGLVKSTFMRTGNISTSQLFLAIFSYTMRNKTDSEPFNIWYRPEVRPKDLQLLVNFGSKFFDFMINCTRRSDPMYPKMDLVIFSDIRTIESYSTIGVTSIRADRVIFNENESTTTDKLTAISTIANAIAAQWIGVLTHPEKRSHFWIYRSIAKYVSDFIVDKFEPSWRIYDQILAHSFLWSRTSYEYPSSIPIRSSLFNTWTGNDYYHGDYNIVVRGASLIRVIHELNNFTDIRKLLKDFFDKSKHVAFEPFIANLSYNNSAPYTSTMTDGWLDNPGNPIVHILVEKEEPKITLLQERFYALGPWGQLLYQWWIPIRCLQKVNQTYSYYWINPNISRNRLSLSTQWCLLNSTTSAIYRLNYPDDWWVLLINKLMNDRTSIDEMHRMRIIDDALHLLLATYKTPDTFFNLSRYIETEVDYFPWLAAGKAFKILRSILKFGNNENRKEYFRRYVLRVVTKVYDYVGSEPRKGENYIMKLHRKHVLDLACAFGHEDCLKIAQERLICYLSLGYNDAGKLQDNKCINDPDIQEIFFCQGLRHASNNTWQRAFRFLNDPKIFHAKRSMIERSLVCSENSTILEWYLKHIFENKIKLMDEDMCPVLVIAAGISEEKAGIILRWIVELYESFVYNVDLLRGIIACIHRIVRKVYSYDMIDRVFLPFLKKNAKIIGPIMTEQMRDMAVTNVIIINEVRPIIEEWLDKMSSIKINDVN